MARKQKVEVIWLTKPSPEAILSAQLLLLGWPESEIRRALEDEQRAIKEKGDGCRRKREAA